MLSSNFIRSMKATNFKFREKNDEITIDKLHEKNKFRIDQIAKTVPFIPNLSQIIPPFATKLSISFEGIRCRNRNFQHTLYLRIIVNNSVFSSML